MGQGLITPGESTVRAPEVLLPAAEFLQAHCQEAPLCPGEEVADRWFDYKARKMAAGAEGHETLDTGKLREVWTRQETEACEWAWAKLMAGEGGKEDLEEIHHIGGIPLAAIARARRATASGKYANEGNAWLNACAGNGGDEDGTTLHVTRITSHADLPGGKAVEQDAGDEHVMLDEGSVRRGRVRYVGKREELRPHDKKVKRDHYVPCWLSKGFTDTGERNGKFTVFRRGRDPYRGTPEGWGVEHGFYTEGDANIDAQWADSEGADGKLLNRLRRDGVQAGDANDIPGLLTRLAARTKNTREMLVQCAEEVGETVLAQEAQHGKDGRELKRRTVQRLKQGDVELAERVRRTLQAKGVHDPNQWRIQRELKKLAKKAARLPSETYASITGRAVAIEMENAKQRARVAHLDLLHRDVQAGRVLPKYATKGMGYGTYKVEQPVLCLGDCPIIEDRQGGEDRAYHPYEAPKLVLEAVYLPIAPDTVLVGRKEGGKVQDVDWFLRGIAALSRETFVARESSPETAFMHERIGTRRPGLTEEEIVDALMDTRWGEEWTAATPRPGPSR